MFKLSTFYRCNIFSTDILIFFFNFTTSCSLCFNLDMRVLVEFRSWANFLDWEVVFIRELALLIFLLLVGVWFPILPDNEGFSVVTSFFILTFGMTYKHFVEIKIFLTNKTSQKHFAIFVPIMTSSVTILWNFEVSIFGDLSTHGPPWQIFLEVSLFSMNCNSSAVVRYVVESSDMGSFCRRPFNVEVKPSSSRTSYEAK